MVLIVIQVNISTFRESQQGVDVPLARASSENLHEPAKSIDYGNYGNVDQIEPEENEYFLVKHVHCEKTLEPVRLVITQITFVNFADGYQWECLCLKPYYMILSFKLDSNMRDTFLCLSRKILEGMRKVFVIPTFT